jgi:hypothetical protein
VKGYQDADGTVAPGVTLPANAQGPLSGPAGTSMQGNTNWFGQLQGPGAGGVTTGGMQVGTGGQLPLKSRIGAVGRWASSTLQQAAKSPDHAQQFASVDPAEIFKLDGMDRLTPAEQAAWFSQADLLHERSGWRGPEDAFQSSLLIQKDNPFGDNTWFGGAFTSLTQRVANQATASMLDSRMQVALGGALGTDAQTAAQEVWSRQQQFIGNVASQGGGGLPGVVPPKPAGQIGQVRASNLMGTAEWAVASGEDRNEAWWLSRQPKTSVDPTTGEVIVGGVKAIPNASVNIHGLPPPKAGITVKGGIKPVVEPVKPPDQKPPPPPPNLKIPGQVQTPTTTPKQGSTPINIHGTPPKTPASYYGSTPLGAGNTGSTAGRKTGF